MDLREPEWNQQSFSAQDPTNCALQPVLILPQGEESTHSAPNVRLPFVIELLH